MNDSPSLITCANLTGMETNQKIKMRKQDGIFITAENDYAVMHDSRNWWIIAPIIDGAVQYGSNHSVFINGTYGDAVAHINEMRGN